ncbi:MAG: MBL fold metallo-hydrolase [Deltaproteobacteria bacterium]|jgi:glyoxylase-like metal-dependent hydrolase (beta-lactamase superfamily II)|nr:MBL fold metallo-hydrolase [Deltaproteobacteria bacterium]MBT4262934.1 MBL fold metallo-hydrolase [Deltaproteobacteria bacterium]MBT4641726.1 MBL fold metallo-hydrolase [Deltaproteobacteria bacterium]MBT6504623.1 MBL fold metallo-hydrolase [Deltaproteobacteria bacterium]MBT6613007.1 MBL fold metallo-hydrolase [Deltaproteobacteria bacterium]
MQSIVDFGPVRFIRGLKNGRYPFCNSIFIESAGVLIDPASDRKILEQLKSKVNTVWLSHWHEDHIMHLDLFEETTLCMHHLDGPPLESLDVFIDWYGAEIQGSPHLKARWEKLLLEEFNYKPRSIDQDFSDGQCIDLDGLTVEVIHTPGHSPGHLSFYFVEPEILFLGDYDLTPFGPWYGDRYSNIDEIIQSIRKLRQIPAKVWLTSHEFGIVESGNQIIWDDYLKVIDQREEKLLAFLEQPRTIKEIGEAWIIYGKPKEPMDEFELMEQISMKKHAERLIRCGEVVFSGDKYYRK